ncbi:MAG: hypothetical protein HY791_25080 [Deltaproteobacteria bacterium]|nr:hypothetical protein [Deltaproteobacteria bacterium]
MRCFAWLIAALVAMVEAPALAESREVVLAVSGANVQAAIEASGFLYVAVLEPLPEQEAPVLESVPTSIRARLEWVAPGRLGLELRSEERILSANVRREGSRTRIALTTRSAREAVAERIGQFQLGPATESGALRLARKHALARRFEEATKVLSSLESREELRAWVRLGLADVALIDGSTTAACKKYLEVATADPRRTPGLVAALRTVTLGCASAVGGTSLASLVYELGAMDGPARAELQAELDAAISQVTAPSLTESLLGALECDKCTAPPAPDETHTCERLERFTLPCGPLVARSVMLGGSPFAIAQTFLSRRRLACSVPESAEVARMTMRAFRDLDLDPAAEQLGECVAGRGNALFDRLGGLGPAYRKPAKSKVASIPAASRLTELETRVRALSALVLPAAEAGHE